jgi:hypothetical protein
MVLGGIALRPILVAVDGSGLLTDRSAISAWIYNGGTTGARTLLGGSPSFLCGEDWDVLVEVDRNPP